MPRRRPTSSAVNRLPARAIRSVVPASLSTPMATVSHQPAPGTRTPVCSLLAARSISTPGGHSGHPRDAVTQDCRKRAQASAANEYAKHSRPSFTADSSSGAAVTTAKNSASCCVAQPEEAVIWSAVGPTRSQWEDWARTLNRPRRRPRRPALALHRTLKPPEGDGHSSRLIVCTRFYRHVAHIT